MKVKAFYTVYTLEGKEWESVPEELDEDALYQAGALCRNISKLTYLAIPTIDAMGRKTSMYFNPTNIVALRLTEIEI